MKIICGNNFLVCYEKLSHSYSNVKMVFCEYNIDKFDDSLYENLSFEEPEIIKLSVKKRRAEFLAGRMAAVNALKLIGESASDIPIGEHRNPIWPSGISGSITHSSNIALAVVANIKDVQFVGIDCEGILSSNVSESISQIILTDDEMSYLKENDMALNFFCTFVFSAKESLFKAVYPYINRYLEFDVANVFEICFVNKMFKIKLTKKITSELSVGRCFTGYFEFKNDHILTMIAC